MDNNTVILKILPHAISTKENQNASIWSVAKYSMLHSKFVNNYTIISPDTLNRLKNFKIPIVYISTNETQERLKKGIQENMAISRKDYYQEVIKRVIKLSPNMIEVEGDYRLAAVLGKTFPNKPVIFISHNIFTKRQFFSRLVQYIKYIRYIKHIIFVSKSHFDVFTKHLFYAKNKCSIIHNSYAHITKDSETIKSINYNNKENKILFAGRALCSKGYQEFLIAVSKVLPNNKNWKAEAILAVEYKDHQKDLDSFIDNNPIIKSLVESKQLNMIYNLSNTLLFDKFISSKIAVFPTHKRFIEGLPLVGIEAQLAKCAVIASPDAGFKELCRSTALFLSSNTPPEVDDIVNKIEYLINNEQKANDLATKGQLNILTNHNIATLVTKYDTLRESYIQNN